MSTITWLHLTDLHFRAGELYKWDQDIVLSALMNDVRERIKSDGLRPDLILVSGDIAFSGLPQEYDLARQFFDELLKVTSLSKERLLVVPGNHDVDRSASSPGAKAISKSLNDRQAVADVLSHDQDRRLLFRKLDAYAQFVGDYFSGKIPFNDKDYFYRLSFNLADRRVAVLGINSAWLSTSEEDRGQLILGEQQVRNAINASSDADLRIALMHHPFDWLKEFDWDDCEAILIKNCDFILHGHLHRASLNSLKTPDSRAIIIAADASYATRQNQNRYNWMQLKLDLETEQGTVFLRMYSDERGGFWTKDVKTYPNVSDGQYTFSLLSPGEMQMKSKRQRPAVQAIFTAETTRWKEAYLRRMVVSCNALQLATLGGKEGADQDITQDITLDRVYIDLNTTTTVPLTEEEKRRRRTEEEMRGRRAGKLILGGVEDTRLLTALEAADQSPRLALLGEPGAGKSTFARKLLGWLAAAHLAGTKPPPGFTSDLLPIQITLRDLTPRLAALKLNDLPDNLRREELAVAVRDVILDNLDQLEVGAFAEGMKDALRSGKCLLVMDNLDEVPHDLRVRVRQAIASVTDKYNMQRMILICRVRSYVGEAVLPGFQAHTLSPFNEDQIGRFAKAWYDAQKRLGRVNAEQAQRKAQNLSSAALSQDLIKLAANPMMLTTMAIIHQQEVDLPKERVRLYNEAVKVLLLRWQRRKTGEKGLAPGLTGFLRDDLRLRPVMERLAYEAHRAGQGQKEAADLPRGMALALLEEPKYLGDGGLAADFLEYVDQRAGLLVGRGGEPGRPLTYSFPHRTFQEYLAGCYMVGQRHVAREFFTRAGEGDYWSLVALLGAEELQYNRRNTVGLLDLAYRLCPSTPPTDEKSRRALLWSGQMAVLAGRDEVERDIESPDGGKCYLERLIPRLVSLMTSDLVALERAEAGHVLAKLGDPRFRSDQWYLPDEPLFGFVEIPKGPFQMGIDKKRDPRAYDAEISQHEVTLPKYYIARYPVTVAQFKAFVKDSRYQLQNEKSLKGMDNHPVVFVTWYDAVAYCEWLTNTKLQS
jgi:3',5'-cyclic AMP phosphodiesterase CpdA